MRFRIFTFLFFLSMNVQADDFKTPFEKGNGNQTTTYEECISYYEKLDAAFSQIKMFSYGTTSVGKPLHLVVISKNENFDPQKIQAENKCVLLINNGIHPGEPDGIDASMMFARDLMLKPELKSLLDHVVICIIPVYNVSGMLNRGTSSRANQNGPEEYGFRGTNQNYDLNRDFVKCDSKEAQTFTEIFQTWKPEIFIDTHVSDGADYQYTMTLIPSQKNKLQPLLASYETKTLLPDLNSMMKESGFETCPYVDPVQDIPDSGIASFLEIPRFSTGYAALFNCIGMMPETHMLKAYSPRVYSTYWLEVNVAKITNRDFQAINQNKQKADEAVADEKEFALNWKLDENKFSMISFKGYAATYKKSEVSGQQRLYYDRNQPYEKEIKYFDDYAAGDSAQKPFAYIIPQGWDKVVERLKWNGVEMKRLSSDTALNVSIYYIDDFKTAQNAYEGHYLHSAVKLHSEELRIQFYKGDYVIIPNQKNNRYIIEMLEPQGTDSYFAWNFFDPILMEKEYFSDYVWEDKAAELLQQNPDLKKMFEQQKLSDTALAHNSQAQLDFIYRHSPYFEKSFKRYPVARLNQPVQLKTE